MCTGGTDRSHTRFLAPLALLAATSATGLAVATDRQLPNPLHIAIVVVACIGYVGMLIADKRWGGLKIGLVAVATVAPVVVALVVIPRFTGDVWSYAMYGRILGVHHLSPWTHAPAAFPHDSLLHLVGRTWRGTPSVYGPAFTAASATSASVLGAGALATRLFYQGLSAVALGGAGWLIWRRTRSAAAVAFLTVHPLVVMYLVNGGRNDILVGVALLAAVVLVSNNRPGAAGVVGALGALVKVTGVVGFVALVVTMVARGERQAARRTVIAAGAVFGAGYAAAGMTALFAPMKTAGALFSRGSPWSLVALLGFAQPSVHVALALLALLVLVVIMRHARNNATTAVTASLGMLSLAAAYTLPGYAAWALPTAALDHRGRVARIIAAAGVVLVVTYEILRHPFVGTTGAALHATATFGGPIVLLALVIALVRTPSPFTEEKPTMSVTQLPTTIPSARPTLSAVVVLPTLDEAANIRSVLSGVRAALPAAQILVVDDGSTDGTRELAECLGRELGQIRVLHRLGPPRARAGLPRRLPHRSRRGLRSGDRNGRRPLPRPKRAAVVDRSSAEWCRPRDRLPLRARRRHARLARRSPIAVTRRRMVRTDPPAPFRPRRHVGIPRLPRTTAARHRRRQRHDHRLRLPDRNDRPGTTSWRIDRGDADRFSQPCRGFLEDVRRDRARSAAHGHSTRAATTRATHGQSGDEMAEHHSARVARVAIRCIPSEPRVRSAQR